MEIKWPERMIRPNQKGNGYISGFNEALELCKQALANAKPADKTPSEKWFENDCPVGNSKPAVNETGLVADESAILNALEIFINSGSANGNEGNRKKCLKYVDDIRKIRSKSCNNLPPSVRLPSEESIAKLLSDMEDKCYASAKYMGTRRSYSGEYAKLIIALLSKPKETK